MTSLDACASITIVASGPPNVTHRIQFREASLVDLQGIYDRIAEAANHDIAYAYVGRIEIACRKLATFPARGTVRNEIYSGLRVIGFERSASIAFVVRDKFVDILRILPRGADLPDEWDTE
ncbi:type II toxin-antitoxin system RelE/ParE family toxin [Rhizobium sp.]